MRAAGAVQELRVQEQRLAVPAGADRDPLLHPVEVERLGALVAGRPVHHRAGRRRHVDLRIDPGGGDLRGLLDLGRQGAVGDGEHIRLELGALVPGAHLGHHAGDRHRVLTGDLAVGDDDVVELQVCTRRHGHPELQRRRVHGAEHASDRLIHPRTPSLEMRLLDASRGTGPDMISRSSVRIRDIVPHDGGSGTGARRASCVRFIARVAVFPRKGHFRRYGVPPPGTARHTRCRSAPASDRNADGTDREPGGVVIQRRGRGHHGVMPSPEAVARRAVRRRSRMARRASRRAVRRPAAPVGRYLHDDLVPLAILRTVSEPAPIVRPEIVALPWWSSAALWVVGVCFLGVAIFLGVVAWNAMH